MVGNAQPQTFFQVAKARHCSTAAGEPTSEFRDREQPGTPAVQWNQELAKALPNQLVKHLDSRRYRSFGPSNLHIGWIIAVEDAHLDDPCLGLDGFDVPSAWD